jgi:hypothetical protein
MLKIYFRIPFTEYFLAKDIKLCLARKIFNPCYEEYGDNYKFIKI